MRFFLFLSVLAPVVGSTAAGAPSSTNVHDDDVEIVYDDNMIPHIFGDTDAAAFYGLGYHHMLEFPIGTLNMLWNFSGRMAEVAGPTYLDEDRLLRLWQVPEVAQRHEGDLASQGLLGLLEAYVDGIEAGRAWWRENGDPATSARIDSLFGPNGEMYVDPVPDYLNPTFSPFGNFNNPTLPLQMRAVVNQLFAAEKPVTVQHVLRLGAVIQSFFLYTGNANSRQVLPPLAQANTLSGPHTPEEETMAPDDSPVMPMSNGWVVSKGASFFRRPMLLSDSHVNFNRIQIRPYLVQVKGHAYEATGLTMPGYPGSFNAFNGNIAWTITAAPPAISQNRWFAQLEQSEAGDLAFEFETGGGTELVELERVDETLLWFNTLNGTMNTFEDTRYFVPVQPSEAQDLGFSRYPVIPTSPNPPSPGSLIRFEQASFSGQRNFWEWTIRMGRARDAHEVRTILDEVGAPFGDGNNLLVTDCDANVLYSLMAKVPIQGTGVPESSYSKTAPLNGADLSARWQGLHPQSDLPVIGPVDLSRKREVWINNNVTPDRVEGQRFGEEDLASFPAYMVSQTPVTTWRQERAIDLLQDLPFKVFPFYSELVARDMTDQWTKEMWPFFEEIPAVAPAGVSANAQLFIDWVNEYRHEDEWGNSNFFYDFVAHRFSRVTVYTVLLRSFYRGSLGSLSTDALQASFGDDPRHPLFDAPGDFTYASYAPNVDSMRTALETVTQIWLLGSGPNGLSNQAQLANLSPLIPGDPWVDPRFDTDIEPHWADIIAGDKVTRWGHVSILPLTPHLQQIPSVSELNNSIPLFQAFLFLGLQPAFLSGLPFPFLRVPFYTNQVPMAVPVGGTEESLLVTKNQIVLDEVGPQGYQGSIYRSSNVDSFFYHPHSSGSQTMFSVQLAPRGSFWPAPWSLFLQAIGGTEITKSDVTGDGSLAYQDRFANSEAFSLGLWRPLITKRSFLGHATYSFEYDPD